MTIRLDALPEMQQLWDQLVQALSAQGIAIDVADWGGYRTAADTATILNIRQAAYDQYTAAGGTLPITGAWNDGASWPIAPFGESYHDFGAARDVEVVSAPAGMSGLAVTAAVDAAAESVGLRTGASFGDPLHVELPITLAEAQAEWAATGGSASSSSSSTVAAVVIIAAAVGAIAIAKSRGGIATWR